MRASVAALVLGGAVLASGCWMGGFAPEDHPPDGGGAGQGGSGGLGGNAGLGGSAAFGGNGGIITMPPPAGIGGSAGFGGSGDACPFGNPNCTEESRIDLCSMLVGCDVIVGAPLTEERCRVEIDERCADCVSVSSSEDGGVGDIACPNLAEECAQACNLLVAPPQDTAECVEIVLGKPAITSSFAACLCDLCFGQYATCVADDGCWSVQQCAAAVGCNGMACFAPNACMAIIDEVGITSIGVALAQDLGNCSAAVCDGLK